VYITGLEKVLKLGRYSRAIWTKKESRGKFSENKKNHENVPRVAETSREKNLGQLKYFPRVHAISRDVQNIKFFRFLLKKHKSSCVLSISGLKKKKRSVFRVN